MHCDAKFKLLEKKAALWLVEFIWRPLDVIFNLFNQEAFEYYIAKTEKIGALEWCTVMPSSSSKKRKLCGQFLCLTHVMAARCHYSI